MTDLDKAREWAKSVGKIEDLMSEPRAAVEVIQSLPNAWVDAEKLRELLHWREVIEQTPIRPAEAHLIERLRTLITPKLPTLADMTAEERKACQWMQADVKLSTGNDSVRCVIADPRTVGARARVWTSHGGSDDVEAERVIPLPGETKLKWPGGEPIEKHGNASLDPQENIDASFKYIKKTTPDQAVAKDVCNSEPNSSETPKSSIKPEDVPADEIWLVEYRGSQWLAQRSRDWSKDFTWRLTSMARGVSMARDSEIILIHKLVPETPALPEGMRLADHKTYGRVVVAPRANTHGEESFYRTNEDISWGASHGYRPTGEFNFLDGDQHV